MVERIIAFLKNCPQLETRMINCGYLGETAGSCSLEAGKKIYEAKRYSDGARLMRRQFVLSIREEYSADFETNLRAHQSCGLIEAWIKQMNQIGFLPDLSGFGTATAISVLQGFRLVSAESLDAKYEAELEVEWYEENTEK